MIDLETVLSEWDEDSNIPQHQLDEVSRQTPKLHAKYLQYLSLTKLQLKRAEMSQKKLLLDKKLYYEGKMSQQDMDSRGWVYDPYDGLAVRTNKDREFYYETDPDIQKSEEKIFYYETLIEHLVNIVDTLKWRHQTIKNMIDWRKFEAGG